VTASKKGSIGLGRGRDGAGVGTNLGERRL